MIHAMHARQQTRPSSKEEHAKVKTSNTYNNTNAYLSSSELELHSDDDEVPDPVNSPRLLVPLGSCHDSHFEGELCQINISIQALSRVVHCSKRCEREYVHNRNGKTRGEGQEGQVSW